MGIGDAWSFSAGNSGPVSPVPPVKWARLLEGMPERADPVTRDPELAGTSANLELPGP